MIIPCDNQHCFQSIVNCPQLCTVHVELEVAANKIIAIITLAGKTQLYHHVTCVNAAIIKSQDRTYLLFPLHTVLIRVFTI
jgi:hypothetical protein